MVDVAGKWNWMKLQWTSIQVLKVNCVKFNYIEDIQLTYLYYCAIQHLWIYVYTVPFYSILLSSKIYMSIVVDS